MRTRLVLCVLFAAVLAGCGQPSRSAPQPPASGFPVDVSPTWSSLFDPNSTATPAAPVSPTPVPTSAKPAAKATPQPKVTTPKPARTTTAPASVYYANCAAVKAAGKAPLHRGQPGYRSGLDRDGDGVACEK